MGVADWGGGHPILLLSYQGTFSSTFFLGLGMIWVDLPSELTCSCSSRLCTAWGWCWSQDCMLPGHGAML